MRILSFLQKQQTIRTVTPITCFLRPSPAHRAKNVSDVVNNLYPQDIVGNSAVYNSLTPAAQQAVQAMVAQNNLNTIVQNEKRSGAVSLSTTSYQLQIVSNSCISRQYGA